jgi:Ca-activated chloride channel family protein
MAALQPPTTAPRERIAIKLLVDCSGSMGGDSIRSARAALRGVLGGLTDLDRASLTRFGSTVDHVLAPADCSARTLRHLVPLVDAMEADLGGTEMEGALRSVFDLPVNTSSADVLLITDGEIWQAQEMIAAAKASGHRVFAIGVGSCPAEGVLRSLAEATGGACEFATPGEALEAAARRMLVRIRQQPWAKVRIDWGSEPVWQSALPAAVFGGDTVIAFAGMATRTQALAVRMLATDAQGGTTELARGEADSPCPGDRLPRIAASQRMANADDPQALLLAIDYQLMSQQTNCILVHRRADADRSTEQAELDRVTSMLAAGWGATSRVVESVSIAYAARSTPSVWRSARRSVGSGLRFCSVSSDSLASPGFLRKQDTGLAPASLQAIALAVAEHLEHGGQLRGLASHCENLELHADVRQALAQALSLGANEGVALLLLAHWANVRKHGLASSLVSAALRPHLGSLNTTLIDECGELFDRLLGGFANDHWRSSRGQRLRWAASTASEAVDDGP